MGFLLVIDVKRFSGPQDSHCHGDSSGSAAGPVCSPLRYIWLIRRREADSRISSSPLGLASLSRPSSSSLLVFFSTRAEASLPHLELVSRHKLSEGLALERTFKTYRCSLAQNVVVIVGCSLFLLEGAGWSFAPVVDLIKLLPSSILISATS